MTIKNFLNRLHKIKPIINSKPCLICCSGGPDSMFLTHIVAELSKLNHHIVYFNHNLRPDETQNEINIVKTLSKKLNYVCHIESLPITEKNQAHYRKKRLESIFKLCEKLNISDVLFGHHLNDDIETLMMQLFRGATTNFRGIRKRTTLNNIDFHHPLLQISKNEILSFLDKQNIEFCNDSSNLKGDYNRNKIRQLLQGFYKTFDYSEKQIATTLNSLKEIENDTINDLKEIKLNEIHLGYWISKETILQHQQPIRVLKVLMETRFNHHLNHEDCKILEIGLNKTELTTLKLKQTSILIDYKWICIQTNHNKINLDTIIFKPNQILTSPIGQFCSTKFLTESQSTSNRLCINEKELKNLSVTTIYNCPQKISSQKKKLRNNEISPIEQMIYPVVSSSKEIIWIPGVYAQNTSGNTIITFQKNNHPLR
tara:strand:+ start:974 stop:2254 length:1281 start_codon:yes stop_codon:yes gene_type:complete